VAWLRVFLPLGQKVTGSSTRLSDRFASVVWVQPQGQGWGSLQSCRTCLGGRWKTLGHLPWTRHPHPISAVSSHTTGHACLLHSAQGMGVTGDRISSPQLVQSPWGGLRRGSPKRHLLHANSVFFLGLLFFTAQNHSRWRFRWATGWHQKSSVPLWHYDYGGFLFHHPIYWSVFAFTGPPGWHTEQVSNGGAGDYKRDAKLQKQMPFWHPGLFSWGKWTSWGVLPRESAVNLSTSSGEGLGRYQHTARARNGNGFLPIRRVNTVSQHHAVSVWGSVSITNVLIFLLENPPFFRVVHCPPTPAPPGARRARLSPGCTAPSKALSSWSGSLVPPLSTPGGEARAHPRFTAVVGLEEVFAPKPGRWGGLTSLQQWSRLTCALPQQWTPLGLVWGTTNPRQWG